MHHNKQYRAETPLLDFNSESIQKLIRTHKWEEKDTYGQIEAVYRFVRDEIKFGYNRKDNLKASQVLDDGYGQCNTKTTLTMALLRALGIPCRFHGFNINRKLQKGAIPNWLYFFSPQKIKHSWVEVYFKGQWIQLEGFIIDRKFLGRIQKKFNTIQGPFTGYGIATRDLQNPEIEWNGNSTYIQKEGICDDLGIFDHPDDFYEKLGTNLKGPKAWFFKLIARKVMNRNVQKIRQNI